MASSRATGRQQRPGSPGGGQRPPSLSYADESARTPSAQRAAAEEIAHDKAAAASAAADMVEDGMCVGLGTGTTAAFLLAALGARELGDVTCVATSPATEREAARLGLRLRSLDEVGELDLAIDGADQIDPDGWLIKGAGGALTREKIVAAAARRFVVIASAEKAVAQLTAPVPLELLQFGAQSTLTALSPAQLRPMPPSPDGGLIADYLGPVDDPRALAARLSAAPGVIEHGLFAPELVSLILIAGPAGIERRAGGEQGGA